MICFAPGMPVACGGTLELTFAADVDPVAQLGRAIDLFDWTGVTPSGAFSVASPYVWNLSNLYTTGEVTLTVLPGAVLGDFNGDSIVDATFLASWKTGFGKTDAATRAHGDADGDHDVDGEDYLLWQRQSGSSATTVSANAPVPEPATSMLFIAASAGILILGGRSVNNSSTRESGNKRPFLSGAAILKNSPV
jgi:hypothetical protein